MAVALNRARRAATLVLLGAIGCGAGCVSSVLSGEDYADLCTVAEDCQAISVGDVCACSCELAAVSSAGADAWLADRERIDCGTELPCDACGPPPPMLCNEGSCTFDLSGL